MIPCLGALTACICLSAPRAVSIDPADRIAAAFATRYHIPGLAFVILKNGSTVVRGEYGYANLATKEKVTANSIFPIASLSKPFVALAVLSLAENRRITLTNPIGGYLTDLPDKWKSIPITHLLDHTSGVPDHYNYGRWDVLDPTPISPDDVYKKLISLPLDFTYGSKYKYSNGNYVLLARLIEKVTGEPYGDFLQQKIFRPLGMKNTKALALSDLPNIVQGYTFSDGKLNPARWNPDWCYGNGALGATTVDLAKLDVGLYTERIVKQSTLAYITTPQQLNDGSLPNYAMGWGIGARRGAKCISHDGKIEGWRSDFCRFTDTNLTVIVVANSGSSPLATLSCDLAGTVDPFLALDPMSDDNPNLTKVHRQFAEAIRDGAVSEDWLSPGLRKDYETKAHWGTIRGWFKEGGDVTLFAPVSRSMEGSELRTRYRMEQGDVVRCITIGCDANGVIGTLLVR